MQRACQSPHLIKKIERNLFLAEKKHVGKEAETIARIGLTMPVTGTMSQKP